MAATDGRLASETPSSSSDFYNTEPLHQQNNVPEPAGSPALSQNGWANTADEQDGEADDDDSSSEMDVSISSRAASLELEPDPMSMPMPSSEPLPDVAPQTTSKRKLDDEGEVANGTTQALSDPSKKRKLSTPLQVHRLGAFKPLDLPVELWQHIFLYLPPAMLCRCLRVCRTFNNHLTSTKAALAQGRTQPKSKNQPRVRVLDSDAIWAHARKTFFSNLPRPLARCTELQMIQLIGGKTCQFCDRPPTPSPPIQPFNCGPGPDGLRVFWPFGVRACGQCMESYAVKDVTLLVSPAVAPLRFGLPYSFLTPDLHFVPEIQRHLPGGIPSHLRVAKVYYVKDVTDIVDECEDANNLGEGAADEWKKGLVTKGKEAMADAARWEQWERQVGWGTDLSRVLREYDLSSFPHYSDEAQSRSAGPNGIQPQPAVNGVHPLPQPVHTFQNGYGAPFPMPNLPLQQSSRPARNPQEVEQARQARRAYIERRCMELDPPLEPNVLQHIVSFQNAMQITMPMTDSAWEALKPMLLEKREAAEIVEHQRAAHMAALQAAVPLDVRDEPYTKLAKEVYDKDYENAQEPLRKKLVEYANGFIKKHWNEGRLLDKDNSPVFAVQTMTHVYRRYQEDKQAGRIPSPDQPVKERSKHGSPMPEPFLSLDNMKWMYDNKIRPLTDSHRRELFICAGCTEDRKPKWFAFEGLIQHYGAKHTTDFSKGNIVVHWQTAKWPEEPPFHMNPSIWVKADRRPIDFKPHERARNTPQATHDGPFVPPGSGKLLSENPLFSTHVPQSPTLPHGHYNVGAQYPPYQYGQPSPQTVQYGFPYQSPVAVEPRVDMSYDARMQKLSTDAREIWDSLDGVKELLECIRIQTMLHHVVERFKERFRQKPDLDLVTDALATNSLVRPVKNAHGLACKICVGSQTDGSANYQSYYARISNVKLYNVSSLITHFKIVHQPQEHAGHFDWTKDMIELPETQLISDLIRAPGMDDDKLAVVAAAFPKAFPSPLPKIGLVKEAPPEVGPDQGLANRLLDRMNKKQNKPTKKKGHHGHGTPMRDDSQEPLPEPKENEYDPRRPYLQNEDQSVDPARFDTDVARKNSVGTSQWGPGNFSLAPETLAALNSLTAMTMQSQNASVDGTGDRSPSVGRAEPSSTLPKAADSTASMPDISAILATLKPRSTQTATPTTVSARSGSAPRHIHSDPYGPPHQVSPRSYHEERPPTARHVPNSAYKGSAEPVARYDAQDLQAALVHNTQHFDHNRTMTYIEPTYAPAPAPAQHPQPQYRYIYEDRQAYTQPPQQAPVYYQEAPVQYIQLPAERERPSPTYQYERAAQKPIYLDERGHPIQLIPVDSAPAPVQYVPHPFERQQQQQQYVRRPEVVAYTAAPPQAAQYVQPAYEDRRATGYYEPAGPALGSQRFSVYDDGARSSVPRG